MMTRRHPLVVDLDGTLIRTDTLHEMIVRLMRQKPWLMLMLPFWFLKGRPFVKKHLYGVVGVDPASLPYNEEVLTFLKDQKKRGRELVLATGSNEHIAQAIADHVGVFDRVIASTDSVNMTGRNKKEALLRDYGSYDYAGDSRIDGHVWEGAEWATVVHPKSRVLWIAHKKAARGIAHVIGRKISRLRAFVLMMGPLQWVAASLVFTAGLYTSYPLLDLILVWEGWCFLLSSAWIFGQLLQIEDIRLKGQISMVAEGHLHLTTPLITAPILFVMGQALILMQDLPVMHTLNIVWALIVAVYAFVGVGDHRKRLVGIAVVSTLLPLFF